MIDRPLLRYHGGKFLLAKWIIGHFASHRIYTEAYGGAASVLLQKPRSYAEIYNDASGDVVNLFRVMRNAAAAKDLRRLLSFTPYAREEYERAKMDACDSIERARRLIVRSFMGFGGGACNPAYLTGFRASANRSGSLPAHDWARLPDSLAAITERLQGVTIECRDALAVLQDHDSPGCLHYVDPPYVHATRSRQSIGAYEFKMADSDHEALASCLRGLSGMVVISGYRCDLQDGLYSDWRRIDKLAFADGARKRTESIWLNAAAAASQFTLFNEPAGEQLAGALK